MPREGISPGSATFVCILKACSTNQALELGQEVHAETIKRGFEKDLYLGTSLVEVYTECRALLEAHNVFDRLLVRNIISWNTLIAGYAKHGLDEEVKNCIQQMPQDGVSPDCFTYVASLKLCCSIQVSQAGQDLHTEATKRGLEHELHLSSTLVGMYAKHGLLSEACHVLNGVPVRDIVSWNGLVTAYIDHGLVEQAARCFWQMQVEGLVPDLVTFICGLKACSCKQDLEKGREIHAEVSKVGFERELFVGNTLVDMYVECCSLAEARHVFYALPCKDAVSWSAFIGGYGECAPGEEVVECFKQMELEGVSPLPSTIICSLKACAAMGALGEGRWVHSETIRRGLESDVYVGSTLVEMYAECGTINEARQVFDALPIQSTAIYNSLITGYVEHGLSEESLSCFREMLLEGISPGSATYAYCLKSCCTLGALKFGQEIHAETIKRGIEKEYNVANTLVDMYSKCGSFLESREVFDSLPFQMSGSWNVLITGYLELGLCEEAVNCYWKMLQEGLSPDGVTFVCILKASVCIQVLGMGQEMHGEAVKRGLDRELHVGSALVDMYFEFGLLVDALQVFDRLLVRDKVSWNVLIAGYVEHGLGEEAIKHFRRMQHEGTSPDCVAFVCTLKGCSITGNLELGQETHIELTKRGWERELNVGSSLVDMYGECASLSETSQVFDKLLVQSDASWTAMIKAYGKNHEGYLAVRCFKEMQEKGVKPSSITFLCLLAACSHSNLVHEGGEYFMLMREHGVEPTLDHYACMVDLFARSGLFDKVEKFLAAMKCQPSSMILYSLLSACKSYGNLELGHKYFQQLVEVNEDCPSAYLLMADIYASAGRWEDSLSIEEARIFAMAKKKAGSTLLELNKQLHVFVVGVNQSEEVSGLLETRSSHMKDEGYVPFVLKGMCQVINGRSTLLSCELKDNCSIGSS